MSYEITQRVEQPRNLAVVRFSATPDQIGARMGAAFGEVYQYLGRHGLQPLGPPVGCYGMGTQRFDVRAGCVVEVPVEAEGSVEPFHLPGGPALVTVHTGPYEELSKAYEALEAHARELGSELDDTIMWEEYLTGPEVPPEQMRTTVHWPLRP